MTRQLFALLALLSGLAALQAPANASPLAAMASDVQASSQAARANSAAVCQCEEAGKTSKRICPQRKAPLPRLRLFGLLGPSIVIGADRALE